MFDDDRIGLFSGSYRAYAWQGLCYGVTLRYTWVIIGLYFLTMFLNIFGAQDVYGDNYYPSEAIILESLIGNSGFIIAILSTFVLASLMSRDYDHDFSEVINATAISISGRSLGLITSIWFINTLILLASIGSIVLFSGASISSINIIWVLIIWTGLQILTLSWTVYCYSLTSGSLAFLYSLAFISCLKLLSYFSPEVIIPSFLPDISINDFSLLEPYKDRIVISVFLAISTFIVLLFSSRRNFIFNRSGVSSAGSVYYRRSTVLVLLISIGLIILINLTNVFLKYATVDKDLTETKYEQLYGKYKNVLGLLPDSIYSKIKYFPDSGKVEWNSRYLLTNNSQHPVNYVLIDFPYSMDVQLKDLDEKIETKIDDDLNVLLVRFDSEIQPGAKVELSMDIRVDDSFFALYKVHPKNIDSRFAAIFLSELLPVTHFNNQKIGRSNKFFDYRKVLQHHISIEYPVGYKLLGSNALAQPSNEEGWLKKIITPKPGIEELVYIIGQFQKAEYTLGDTNIILYLHKNHSKNLSRLESAMVRTGLIGD